MIIQASNGADVDGIFSFNPATDIIQVQSSQAPNFAALHVTYGAFMIGTTYVTISTGGSTAVTLTPANVHFV